MRTRCICGRPKGVDHVACSRCWFKVPNPLRRRIWHLFGTERGSDAHFQAVSAAVQWLQLDLEIILAGRAAQDRGRYSVEKVERENDQRRARQRELFNEGMAASPSAKQKCPVHGIPDCSPLLNGCSWKPQGASCS